MNAQALTILVVLCAALLLAAPAAAVVEITGIEATDRQLVGRERVSRTQFDYLYDITFENAGEPVSNVEAIPYSSNPAFEPQNTLVLGDLPNAIPVVAGEPLRLRIDRRTRFDPAAITWRFFVSGAPDIAATPAALEFGESEATCAVEQDVRIENTGSENLVIDRLRLETDFGFPTFRLDLRLGTGFAPWTLRPGEFRDGFLRYTPPDLATHTATIALDSNDPDTPRLEIPVSGNGFITETAIDTFFQNATDNPKVDILFAVDKSGSMNDTIESTIANVQSFVERLRASDTDYRFAATVADDGCILGDRTFIDPSVDDATAQQTVDDMIAISVAHGANTERGYMLVEAALSPENTGPGGCNAGFIRDDARLDLVFISDEPEQSIFSWLTYVERFRALKTNPDDVKLHAIAGDYPSGCELIESGVRLEIAQAGTGYFEGVASTGGYFLSICTRDWSQELALLADGSSESLDTSFRLSRPALSGTLQVWVDGQPVADGWQHFPSAEDLLLFEPESVPADQANIVVEYGVRPTCEN